MYIYKVFALRCVMLFYLSICCFCCVGSFLLLFFLFNLINYFFFTFDHNIQYNTITNQSNSKSDSVSE